MSRGTRRLLPDGKPKGIGHDAKHFCAGDMPSPMKRMTFFALRGPVSLTLHVTLRWRAIAPIQGNAARLDQRDVAEDQRRLPLAVLALDEVAERPNAVA